MNYKKNTTFSMEQFQKNKPGLIQNFDVLRPSNILVNIEHKLFSHRDRISNCLQLIYFKHEWRPKVVAKFKKNGNFKSKVKNTPTLDPFY